MTKVYFPNLNGLRFIAALLVIIHHIEQMKSLLGFENNWSNAVVVLIGKLGVVLFFVLSGFLITYLLLVEEKETNTISIKAFYIRRFLRIWPLYYLLVGLSFFLFSHIPFLHIGTWSAVFFDGFSIKLILFMLFLPNVAMNIYAPIPFANQLWSVGIEEQFYLIWPILMKKIRNKKVLLYAVIFGYLFIKTIGFACLHKILVGNETLHIAESIFDSFSIDCMAIGSLFAFLLFTKHRLLNFFSSIYVQAASYIAIVLLIAKGIDIPYIQNECYGMLFGIVILNMAANEKSMLKLEYKPLHYLGKISYGLYMYHPFAIVISIKLLDGMHITNAAAQYASSILLTILISALSYRFYERYFIRKKLKYSNVISG